MRILCVQPSADDRRKVVETLAGYAVATAADARSALHEIEAGAFDLYILDRWLPDRDGTNLCQDIRGNDPHVPVIFLTAAAREEDRSQALSTGASAYLLKPIDPPELLRKVRIYTELANLQSTRARTAQEAAIMDELRDKAQQLKLRPDVAALKRSMRGKALRAFVEKGGTVSHFDRWWPRLFEEPIAGAWPAVGQPRAPGAGIDTRL